MNYTIYFNKKYNRIGHLWQGRFKSYYVANEAYYFILMRYIEQNPLKAKIVKDLKDYKYSSYHLFLNYNNIPSCLKNSYIVKKFKNRKKDIQYLLLKPIDNDELIELKKASSLVEAPLKKVTFSEEKLIKMFSNYKDIKERNTIILKAYKLGYSQAKIAKVLNISQQAVFKIIKRNKERL